MFDSIKNFFTGLWDKMSGNGFLLVALSIFVLMGLPFSSWLAVASLVYFVWSVYADKK